MRTISSVLCLSVLLSIPSLAAAAEVVLPPLVPRGATTVQQVANITQLMSSEMDFMSEVDRVIELSRAPSGYNAACVDSASCLSRVGREAGGEYVVAGTLRMTDDTMFLELVYYDASRGRFLRRKSFELPNRPEIIADNMDDVVKELITGEAPRSDEEAVADSFDLVDFDDDLDLGFDESDFESARRDEAAESARREAEARRKREEAARRAAEDEARRRAEAEAEARRVAEVEARRRAEAEERRRAEAEERRRAEAEAQRQAERDEVEAAARREAERRQADEEPEFDPSMISFGSSSIIVEDGPDADEEPVVEDEPVRTRATPTPSYFEDLDADEDAVADLDEPEPRARPERSQAAPRDKVVRERSPRQSSGFDSDPTAVQLTLRGGYNPYFNLGFVTYGGELSVALGDSGARALVGVEAWSVQRDIPERFQADAGAPTEWNTIIPLSAGVVYAFDLADGRVKPYLGGDVIGAQYYVPDTGSAIGNWSVGVRARGGVDLMVVRNFGLNLNAGMGFWSGKDWVVIEKDVRNAGLLPQVSAGTVFAF